MAAGEIRPGWLVTLIAVSIGTLLSTVSCVAPAPVPEERVAQPAKLIAEREQKLAALKPWRVRGSMVVDSRDQGAVNASFNWRVAQDGFDIRLFGPLGRQAYRVIEDAGGATLYSAEGEISGRSAEQLIYDMMGVAVPLTGMQDWAVGLKGSGSQARRDGQGRLRHLIVEQDDDLRWDVSFETYSKVDDLDLPRSILVSGDGVEIKLSFKQWGEISAGDGPPPPPPLPGLSG